MSTDHLIEEIGNWKKERVLGAGGFGYVVLWRNKVSNETIALKECRWGHDPMMTSKHRGRWKLEVDMMSRLNHPNVVTAIPVPPELDVPTTEMPLLAMEYCSNGDLRKLLNRPENCCGLKEKHVRLIMRHVSSAINYLHSKRIIHRDLKPENIVIQEQNGSVVYKLIDLGYAKELDQGSLCTSFVGTLQYLAPELFTSQKYSSTVDYWSLGLLTHEVITGSRPFLPDKSPAEWIPIIKTKKHTEIRAYLDADKNIVFSTEISPFHHISSTFKKEVEKWLQLMLEWDPKKRGKSENLTAFSLLDSALEKKIALVFCADTFRFISLPIKEDMSLDDFSKELEIASKIPVSQQEIILADGRLPDATKGASQFVSNLEEEEMIIFLFDKSDSLSTLSPPYTTVIPPAVENMMRNPHVEVEYQLQRIAWSQAVFLSQQECTLASRLVQAFKANLIDLLTLTSKVHKTVCRMTADMNELLAKVSLFKNSLDQDLKSYESQCGTGFESELLHEEWKSSYENLKKVEILKQKISNLESTASNITVYTVELQRSPYSRSKLNTPLEDIHQKILESFAELRRRPSEQRRQLHDNKDIVRSLCLCLQHSHTQTLDLVSLIRKIKQSKKNIADIKLQFYNLLREVAHWDSQIIVWQADRQMALWKLIETLCEKVHEVEKLPETPVDLPLSPRSSSSGKSRNGIASPSRCSPDSGLRHLQESPKPSALLKTPPIITPPSWQNRFVSLSLSSSPLNETGSLKRTMFNSSTFNGPPSLSNLLDKTTEESRNIKKENEKLVESFQNMMEVLKSYPGTESSNENQDLGDILTSPKVEQ